jgi:hypothetical protein
VQAQLQLVDPARARMGVGMRLGAAVAVADALGVGGCGMCMCTFVERLLLAREGIRTSEADSFSASAVKPVENAVGHGAPQRSRRAEKRAGDAAVCVACGVQPTRSGPLLFLATESYRRASQVSTWASHPST